MIRGHVPHPAAGDTEIWTAHQRILTPHEDTPTRHDRHGNRMDAEHDPWSDECNTPHRGLNDKDPDDTRREQEEPRGDEPQVGPEHPEHGCLAPSLRALHAKDHCWGGSPIPRTGLVGSSDLRSRSSNPTTDCQPFRTASISYSTPHSGQWPITGLCARLYPHLRQKRPSFSRSSRRIPLPHRIKNTKLMAPAKTTAPTNAAATPHPAFDAGTAKTAPSKKGMAGQSPIFKIVKREPCNGGP